MAERHAFRTHSSKLALRNECPTKESKPLHSRSLTRMDFHQIRYHLLANRSHQSNLHHLLSLTIAACFPADHSIHVTQTLRYSPCSKLEVFYPKDKKRHSKVHYSHSQFDRPLTKDPSLLMRYRLLLASTLATGQSKLPNCDKSNALLL